MGVMTVSQLKRIATLMCGLALSAVCFGQNQFENGLNAYLAGNYAAAYELWRPLTEQGDVVAIFNVGVLYAHGRGVAQDLPEAVNWFRRAAELGYAPAQFNLGAAYRDGSGVEVDLQQTLRWWTKAAVQGHPQSLFNLATMYRRGDSVAADLEQAVALYRRAAAQGDPRAKLALRTLATKEKIPAAAQAPLPPPPAKRNEVKREAWILAQNPEHLTLQLAAYADEQSLHGFVAQQRLNRDHLAYFQVRDGTRGWWYKIIYGVFTNARNAEAAHAALPAPLNQSVPWVRPFAAVQTEIKRDAEDRTLGATAPPTVAVVDSASEQLRHGQIAFNAQNYAQALKIWRPLAEEGLPAAQYNLGFLYESGWGIERDATLAARWYEAAARQGHAKAQFNLGLLYVQGRGVDKNESTGMRWISNAANQQDVRAIDYLNDGRRRN